MRGSRCDTQTKNESLGIIEIMEVGLPLFWLQTLCCQFLYTWTGSHDPNLEQIVSVYVYIHSMLRCFTCVQLFVILWIETCQAPLSMGFSRQEYWSGLPCPPPWALPDPTIEPVSLTFSELAGRFFYTSATWDTLYTYIYNYFSFDPGLLFICLFANRL